MAIIIMSWTSFPKLQRRLFLGQFQKAAVGLLDTMASKNSILPLLRAHAPRLTRHFFSSCRACPNRQASKTTQRTISSSAAQYKSRRQTPFLKAFRSQSTLTQEAGPLFSRARNNAAGDLAGEASGAHSRGFPKLSSGAAGWWLLGSAASVYAIVVLGGLTRLTESGYADSMWKMTDMTDTRSQSEHNGMEASHGYDASHRC